LRAEVQRLEQVGLAGAVRTDDENESRLEIEIETRVRADVAQRDRLDDQISRLRRRLSVPTIEGVRALPVRPFAFESAPFTPPPSRPIYYPGRRIGMIR
jgi:hypothetical protein